MCVDREEISVRIAPAPVSGPSRTSSYLSPFAPHARTGIPVVGHAEASVPAPTSNLAAHANAHRAPARAGASQHHVAAPVQPQVTTPVQGAAVVPSQPKVVAPAQRPQLSSTNGGSGLERAGAGSDAGSGGVDLGGVGRVLTWRLPLSAIRARLLGRPAFSRSCRHVVGSVARWSRCRVAVLCKPSVRAGIPCEEREQLHHRALVEKGHAAV